MCLAHFLLDSSMQHTRQTRHGHTRASISSLLTLVNADTGISGLMAVCYNGHHDTLLAVCSSPLFATAACTTDNNGTTPMMFATMTGRADIVETLLRQPCRDLFLNAINRNGRTALHMACLLADVKITQLLLGVPNINRSVFAAEFTFGDTPLHVACGVRCAVIVASLLAHPNVSALLCVKNHNMETPLLLALRHGQGTETRLIVNLLRSTPGCEPSVKHAAGLGYIALRRGGPQRTPGL